MADYIPPEYQSEIAKINRQRAMAQALLQNSFSPKETEVVSGRAVPQGGLQSIAKLLTGGISNYNLGELDTQASGLQGKIGQARQQQMQGILAKPPQEAINEAAMSEDPRVRELTSLLISRIPKPQGPMVVGPNASIYDPANPGEPIYTNKVDAKLTPKEFSELGRLLQEQQNHTPGSREYKIYEERISKLNTPPVGIQVSYGGLVPGVDAATGKPAFGRPDNRGGVSLVPNLVPPPKDKPEKTPPAAIAKLQDELLGDVGIASGISADLKELDSQISSGKLSFGLVTNLVNKGLNATNNSTPASRNAQTAQASLEKLRNDSLRLNKGTQTEGDAVRAWTENFPSLNDTAGVSQRLKQIATLNERAVKEKKQRLNQVRKDYGQEPIDTKPFEVTTPATAPTSDKEVLRFDANGNQLP
jgi:hypothetical protein